MTHAQAMKRRVPILADSDCPGELTRRIFKGRRNVECRKCGAKLFFNFEGEVFIAAIGPRPLTIANEQTEKTNADA